LLPITRTPRAQAIVLGVGLTNFSWSRARGGGRVGTLGCDALAAIPAIHEHRRYIDARRALRGAGRRPAPVGAATFRVRRSRPWTERLIRRDPVNPLLSMRTRHAQGA